MACLLPPKPTWSRLFTPVTRNYASNIPRQPPPPPPKVEAFEGPSQPGQYYQRPYPRQLPKHKVYLTLHQHRTFPSLTCHAEKMADRSRSHSHRRSVLGDLPHIRYEPRENLKFGVQVHHALCKAGPEIA